MRKRAWLVISLLASLPVLWPDAANAEAPIAGEGPVQAYLTALHAKVHRAWVGSFLALATAQLPKDHPVNLATRTAVIELVLSPEGKIVGATLDQSSGAAEFDTAAVDAIKDNAPFAAAPEESRSDDGNVHVLWTMARDDRQCSGLHVVNREGPLDQAIPGLVKQGRDELAVRRLQESEEGARAQGLTMFARAWLERASADKDIALAVAAARALGGDASGAERLRQGLSVASEVEKAAQGLAALKEPVCAAVKEQLNGQGQARTIALSALRFRLDDECVAAVMAIAKDTRVPLPERVAAIEALGTSENSGARHLLQELAKDGPPAIRRVALPAWARQGGGRAMFFYLTSLLRHPSLDVRTGASVGLLRAGGEAAIEQLFLLFKEKDVRIYQEVARQLAALSGEPSAEMLGKLLRSRRDPQIRRAGALALAARRDPAASRWQTTLVSAKEPELKLLAGVALDGPSRLAVAAAPEGHAWRDAYVALAAGASRLAAADWALVQLSNLQPPERADVLGVWLAGVRPAEAPAPSGQ